MESALGLWSKSGRVLSVSQKCLDEKRHLSEVTVKRDEVTYSCLHTPDTPLHVLYTTAGTGPMSDHTAHSTDHRVGKGLGTG